MIHFADERKRLAIEAGKGFFNIDLTGQRGRQR
jgi:hypothetical protein